jgi:hypothetical protein
MDLGEHIFMWPLFLMALDYLMEIFGWGIMLTSLVFISHVLALLTTPWLHIQWLWHMHLIIVWF